VKKRLATRRRTRRPAIGEIVPLQSGYNLSYVVAPDGQRFLISTVIEEPAASPISVMLNWQPAQ